MRTPAELYTPSARSYQGLPEIDYPIHDRDALVTACGRICMMRKKINISTVMAGQRLGLKEVDDALPSAERTGVLPGDLQDAPCASVGCFGGRRRFNDPDLSETRGPLRRGSKRHFAPKGMAQDMHRPTDGVYDSGDILTLAFERIGGRIAAGTAPTSIQRPHGEVTLQRRTD